MMRRRESLKNLLELVNVHPWEQSLRNYDGDGTVSPQYGSWRGKLTRAWSAPAMPSSVPSSSTEQPLRELGDEILLSLGRNHDNHDNAPLTGPAESSGWSTEHHQQVEARRQGCDNDYDINESESSNSENDIERFLM
jgi:hypothetical protein